MQIASKPTAGFTLVEVLIVVGLSAMIAAGVGSFLVNMNKAHNNIIAKLDHENTLNLVRNHIQCGIKCAEAKKNIPGQLHGMSLKVVCQDWYDDVAIYYRSLKEKGADWKLLFNSNGGTGNGNICQPRKSNNCVYGCHNRGMLVQRGFLYPPVDQDFNLDTDLSCPGDNEIVGFDFALNRLVCADDETWGQGGPLCQQERHIHVGAQETFNVDIGGNTMCTEYTSVGAETVMIKGTLQVKLAPDYVPSSGDRFIILKSALGKLNGKFYGNKDGTVNAGDGYFKILYTDKKVILTGYRKFDD